LLETRSSPSLKLPAFKSLFQFISKAVQGANESDKTEWIIDGSNCDKLEKSNELYIDFMLIDFVHQHL
jgi:hypothetical protein